MTGDTTHYLARGAGGDRAALEMLARALRCQLELMCRHRLPPRIRAVYSEEDLMQDTWVVTLRALQRGGIRSRGGRRTPVLLRFMRSTVENLVRSALRQRFVLGSTSVAAAMAHPGRALISRIEHDDLGAAACRAIDQLDDPDRSIVFMRAIEQRSFVEIASLLGLTKEQVRKRYGRRIAALRKRFAGSFLDGGGGESVS